MTTEQKTISAAGETIHEAQFDPRIAGYGRVQISGFLAITIIGIPLVPFWLALSLWYYPEYLRRISSHLTTRNVEIRKGVFFRKEITIPLNRITDVRLHDGPLMRHFGVRGLRVETAGGSGNQVGSEGDLVGVVDPVEYRDAILRQRDIVLGSSVDDEYDPAASKPAATAGAPDNALLTEIRDILKRIEEQGRT